MSVINKMLEDLDRRQGVGIPDDAAPNHVRAVSAGASGRRRVWGAVIGLLVIGSAGAAWLVRSEVRETPVPVPVAARQAPVPAPVAVASPGTSMAPPVATPAETLKLARALEGPIPEPRAAAEPAAPKRVSPPATTPASGGVPSPVPPPAAVAAATPTASSPAERAPAAPPSTGSGTRVEKRDRVAPPEERAETAFRRAVLAMNQGRVSEAFQELNVSLELQPGHEAARQALVALHLERGELDAAQRRLEEGLSMNRGQAAFTVALARILVERRDYTATLDVTQRATDAAARDPDVLALRGAALQRLNRHAEAAEAYRHSLRERSESAASWVGLGISLEALGHKPEAAEAYRRGLRAGPLAAGVREYAEQRLRQIR